MDFHLRQAACVDVCGKITTKVCGNRERYYLISCHLSGCLENDDLENEDLRPRKRRPRKRRPRKRWPRKRWPTKRRPTKRRPTKRRPRKRRPETKTFSDRVCRPCARKLRNGAQLYSFIEKAVTNTIIEEDLHREAVEDRSKRQLPTIITPEISDLRKKRLASDGEQLKDPERLILERPCLQKARHWVSRRTLNRELLVLKHFIHRRLSK